MSLGFIYLRTSPIFDASSDMGILTQRELHASSLEMRLFLTEIKNKKTVVARIGQLVIQKRWFIDNSSIKLFFTSHLFPVS